jgi:ABC-2 type transport system ATP-binding protein
MKHASRSIVLCMHDLDEAERLADQIAILRKGNIVACDRPAALRARASPETTVEVLLAGPCPTALMALASIEGVEAPQVRAPDSAEAAPDSLTYRTRNPTEVNPIALERLIRAGARIVSVTCATRSLEEVYASAIAEGEK